MMDNGMLSQEEIDALLNGNVESDNSTQSTEMFSDVEKDAIGEIANISMGTAATTLSQLLGKKVEITTPVVSVSTLEQIIKEYPVPSVIVDVKFKAGVEGSNILILSQRDGAVIVDLMMGGDGQPDSSELSELQMSGISEAMNQMMGSAATSMSTMFKSLVDITPPNLFLKDLNEAEVEPDVFQNFQPNGELICVAFRMVVEGVIDSRLIQLIPISVAKGMVDKLIASMNEDTGASPSQVEQTTQPQAPAKPTMPSQPEPQASGSISQPPPQPREPQVQYQQDNIQQAPPYQQAQPQAQHQTQQQAAYNYGTTTVQPAQFAPLKPTAAQLDQDNLGLILDVPLQVTVELGKAKKTIKEILDMGPGSVVELDRLAGEPVDMLVNGKLVAKCEVVVINESFGIRITEIIHPSERMPQRL